MMSISEYRSHPAMSYSKLKAYYKSPLHGLMQRPPAESTALRFGSAVDLACKNQFSEIICNPHDDGRTKAAKDFKAANQGKLIVSQSEYEDVGLAYAQIAQHPAVKKLALGFGEDDKPLFGTLEGIQVKGLPDWIVGENVIDLKTTGNGISPEQFARTVDNFGWDIQAAMYLELARQNGIANPEFYWVAVESSSPFDVAVYRATEVIKQFGKTKLLRAIENFKKASSGNAVGISQEVCDLQMPAWYARQLGHE